jgi:Succinyl-CoA ligase like flavodoxin domain
MPPTPPGDISRRHSASFSPVVVCAAMTFNSAGTDLRPWPSGSATRTSPACGTCTARRVAAGMPVLTVEAGRSEAGQLAAASRTAAVATPLVTREALFAQAGIIAVPGFGDLIEATALLASPASAAEYSSRSAGYRAEDPDGTKDPGGVSYLLRRSRL